MKRSNGMFVEKINGGLISYSLPTLSLIIYRGDCTSDKHWEDYKWWANFLFYSRLQLLFIEETTLQDKHKVYKQDTFYHNS